jgi:two-component system sensor kinase FixL
MTQPEPQAHLDAEATRQLRERLTRLAHELNQPLTAVANYAQACDRLLGMQDPDIEEVREALRQITTQAVRAGNIIHELLRSLRQTDL